MINISSLSFSFPQTSQYVLNDVNLRIESGSLTLVTGATGSGKSTLLRCINGLVPHFSGGAIKGQINVFGHDPIQDGPKEMAEHVGFVSQEPEAQFVFDIVENEIAFALESAGFSREKMQNRVNRILHQLNLDDIRQKNIHEISGGEKQKIAIASALVLHPMVLILDEPTSQLDPVSANEILTFITQMKRELGLTVLISEHRLERLIPYADKIAHITKEGKAFSGTPQEILLKMEQAPPLIQIARKMNLSPLPLTVADFPKTENLPCNPKQEYEARLPDEESALEVVNLSAILGGKKILEQINLQLYQGEILTLVGLNGAGKTTLLRSILGLTPSSGQRRLYGKNMEKMELSEVIRHIAYLPQNPNDLLFAESVAKELKITLKNHNLYLDESEISNFLDLFQLNPLKERYPRDLSVGERQRTALAAITVHQPQIIFLDEPTRGLDYDAKKSLSNIIKRWRYDKCAIFLVTHDVEFAAQVADRVVILENGFIHFDGTPQKAFSKFSAYRTQTSRLFPNYDWITPEDVC